MKEQHIHSNNRAEGKWFVIVNPVANNWTSAVKWPLVKQELERYQFDFEFKMTDKQRDASNYVLEAASQSYTRFMSVGGDGTMNEVVNGILLQKTVSPLNCLFTHIPLGSMNDWAKMHKIPLDFREWIPIIKDGRVIQQDVGKVEYMYNTIKTDWHFCNMAGVGYPGAVAKIVNDDDDRVIGKNYRVYMMNAMHLFRYKKRQHTIIHDNEKEYKGRFLMVNVGIGRKINNLRLTPHAIYNDGYLAVSHDAGAITRLDLARIFRKVLFTRPFQDKDAVYGKVKNMRIETVNNEKSYIQADGEYLGETPCSFSIIPKAINVLVPQKESHKP